LVFESDLINNMSGHVSVVSDCDDDVSMASIEKDRRSKWRIKGEEEELDDDRCPDCVASEEKIDDLNFELNAERHAADETIRMVEKMEEEHKLEIEKLNMDLNFEKDKVVALTNTLHHERKARMQEIYKIERKTMENDNSMKDYKNINEMNNNLGKEFEAVQSENDTLVKITEELQQNKLHILDQLKTYEDQITDLEKKNNDLRKRLYDADNEKDRHKVQAARMKQKLQDYKNGIGDRTQGGQSKLKSSRSQSLGPLKSFSKVSSIVCCVITSVHQSNICNLITAVCLCAEIRIYADELL